VLADLLDGVSDRLLDGQIDVGVEVSIPGVCLTLWIAGVIMLVAGVLSAAALGGLRSVRTAGTVPEARLNERSVA
ncbi:MAG: hypothetical protein ACRDIL_11760, partial [Candidatus Limnocylindrales bacterium]